MKSDILRKVGKICRDYRETIGLTLANVAQDSGYSVSYISRFENGYASSVDILSWYVSHGLDLAVAWNENRCVCCGELIPEGVQVCPKCEEMVKRYESINMDWSD